MMRALNQRPRPPLIPLVSFPFHYQEKNPRDRPENICYKAQNIHWKEMEKRFSTYFSFKYFFKQGAGLHYFLKAYLSILLTAYRAENSGCDVAWKACLFLHHLN